MLRSSLSATALAAFFVLPALIAPLAPSINTTMTLASIERVAFPHDTNNVIEQTLASKLGKTVTLQSQTLVTAPKDVKITFASPIVSSKPAPPKPKPSPVIESVPNATQAPAQTKQAAVALPPSSTTTTIAEAQAFAKQLLIDRGLDTATSNANFVCLVDLWNRESGWNYQAANPSSGAYGIPQSLPGNKMAAVAPDWQTNANTQIIWGLDYIMGRYGSPCNAHTIWQTQHWY